MEPKVVLKKIGDTIDISGHEDLIRISQQEVLIRKQDTIYVIESDSAIVVKKRDLQDDDYPE